MTSTGHGSLQLRRRSDIFINPLKFYIFRISYEFKSLIKDQLWQLGSNFMIDDVWDKEKSEYTTFYPLVYNNMGH